MPDEGFGCGEIGRERRRRSKALQRVCDPIEHLVGAVTRKGRFCRPGDRGIRRLVP
jgi:hypothetical protein